MLLGLEHGDSFGGGDAVGSSSSAPPSAEAAFSIFLLFFNGPADELGDIDVGEGECAEAAFANFDNVDAADASATVVIVEP
mmetsp:Transcript_22522/g.54452  ORF Transcript_22522/g.54452 Transcript_22522/m.54452 type:complete len:81 (-) Transcript_22522:537-779(-)